MSGRSREQRQEEGSGSHASERVVSKERVWSRSNTEPRRREKTQVL